MREYAEETLAGLDPNQPHYVVERLIQGGVEKALRPWRKSKEIENAIQGARNRLPPLAQGWSLRNPSEWDTRAIRAAAEAIAQLKPDAALAEIQATAIQAGDRVRAQYEGKLAEEEHRRACARVVECLPDGDGKREAVRKALARLRIGANYSEMVRVQEAALAPFRAAEKAAADADRYLNHVNTYVEELGNEETGEWELGTWLERWKLAEKIKADIRPKLIQTLLRDDLDEDEAQDFVEEMVDRQL